MDILESIYEHSLTEPYRVALSEEDNSISYGELCNRIEIFCDEIASANIPNRVPIAISKEASVSSIIKVLAILKSGHAYVPLDFSLPRSKLKHIQEATGVKIVYADSDFSLPNGFIRLNQAKRDCFSKNDCGLDDDIATILATSGSTGAPKCAAISTSSIFNFIKNSVELYQLKKTDIFLALAPLNFDISFFEVFVPLVVGCEIVVPSSRHQLNPFALNQLIQEQGITHLQAVPSRISMILMATESTVNYSNVSVLISTGDSFPYRHLENIQSIFPNADVYNVYGCTETNNSFYHLVSSLSGNSVTNSMGSPYPDVKYKVLDPETLCEVTSKGTLFIASATNMLGYFEGNILKEKATIIDNIAYFNTNDEVEFVGNELFYIGRSDWIVKIFGMRVSIQEIESFFKTKDGVVDAVVVVKSDGITKYLSLVLFVRQDVSFDE